MLLALVLSCAKPAPAPQAGPRLRFTALAEPVPQADGSTLLASAELDGQASPFGWQVLIAEGDKPGDSPLPFGTLVDSQGRPLPDGTAPTCSYPDGNGLVETQGRIWLSTNLECTPATLYRTELSLVDGAFRALRTAPVDLAAVGGTNQLCAAEMTPQGSFLTAEEYEPDAALFKDGQLDISGVVTSTGKAFYDASGWKDFQRFDPGARNPYSVGWMVEVAPDTTVRKRTAMGRFSHELGRTMPDGRTVYLSDDYSFGMLAVFIADTVGDLSAGRLYAARWVEEAGGARLSWVDLGHAREAEIDAAIASGTTFEQLFERTIPAAPGLCPEGLQPVRGPQGVDECLAFKPGQQALATRLETRRAAALLGATVELEKEEGLAVDPVGRRLFVAFTRISNGMLASNPPQGESDHARLPENPCGVVYSFDLEGAQLDTAGAPIDSEWVATSAIPGVAGVPGADGCDPAWPSEPDNVEWMPGAQALLIAEDTDRSPNLLWVWQGGAPVPLLAGPPRPESGRLAEIAGLSWVPSVGGQGWITVSIQHPGGQPARVGVLGPFPASRAR